MSSTEGAKIVTHIGQRFSIEADPDTGANRTGEIKTRIEQEYNIPTDKIVLTTNGVVLKDEDIVAAGTHLDLEFAPDVMVEPGSSSSRASTRSGRASAGAMRTYLRTKVSGSASNADARRLMPPPPPPQKPILIVHVDEDDDHDWLSDEDEDDN